MRVKIVFYTGTGGTAMVAGKLEKHLVNVGHKVVVQQLHHNIKLDESEYDLLYVLFAVHACNAPEPIYRWINQISKVNNIPAVVLSVSGGGEVCPNTACRLSTIKKLEKKGHKVVYEDMIVMPSNWIIPTKFQLAKIILDLLEEKTLRIVQNVDVLEVRRTKSLLIDRVFSKIGELEKIGARFFGKALKVNENCNGCSWCSKSCAAGNIIMVNGKPGFSNKCHLCLNCLYGCPQKAIKPGLLSFAVIKEGYSLKEIEAAKPLTEEIDVEALTKGYVWSGLRKYILDKN